METRAAIGTVWMTVSLNKCSVVTSKVFHFDLARVKFLLKINRKVLNYIGIYLYVVVYVQEFSWLFSLWKLDDSCHPHNPPTQILCTPAASKTPVTCVTQHPALGCRWGGCLCVWVHDGASTRSWWHDRCEAHWAIMSCVQTDNFLADVCESFTNESQINTLIIMRHLGARKQNVEGDSTFLICDASVPGHTDWLHCHHGINMNIATQLSPGGSITRRDTQSMKLAHTSLNAALNYTIQ